MKIFISLVHSWVEPLSRRNEASVPLYSATETFGILSGDAPVKLPLPTSVIITSTPAAGWKSRLPAPAIDWISLTTSALAKDHRLHHDVPVVVALRDLVRTGDN